VDLDPLPLPADAPFGITAVPTGWSRLMTQEEADAANTLYPVPPYGATYIDPEKPGAEPV